MLDVGTGSGIQAFTAMDVKLVREVVGIDINPKAVEILQKEVQEKKSRKIKFLHSDLFANVDGQFNTVIFNPPYLPQDKGILDPAIYGGKKGHEIFERFFRDVSEYLFADGKILLLCSSLTPHTRVQEIVQHSLFEFELLEREKMPMFEELFVYLIWKSKLRLELERKGISKISFFAHGRRGDVFTGFWNKNFHIKKFLSKPEAIKVAVKVKRAESTATERIENEINWLQALNKKGIGPRMLFFGGHYLVYEFVDGVYISDWLEKSGKEETRKVLGEVLQQCFLMDKLGVTKEEMHHPLKHVIIAAGGPVLIDFERTKETKEPQNVTQWVEYICRNKKVLSEKGWLINVEKLRDLAKEYKKPHDQVHLQAILAGLKL